MNKLIVAAVLLTTQPAIAATLTETKLLADDGAAGDRFGISVGMSGSNAVVGSYFHGSSGAAYLYDGTDGTQMHKLTAADGASGDRFGFSVAMDGSTAIVGAYGDDDRGSNSGSAYLFDTATGAQTRKLTASDGASFDRFGQSVAISGNTAVVGAFNDDSAAGAAYVFNATTGNQIAKLTANDSGTGDRLGYSVGVDGTTAIVGAYADDDGGSSSGSAYLFDTTTGAQLFKLTAGDAAGGDSFGYAVAISGTTAIVGAYNDDDAGNSSGSAYLFDTTTGNQIAKLTADDATENDWFGHSVAIAGDIAIVGAYYQGGTGSGAAYLFDVSTGEQIAKILASDGAANDYFGYGVGISEDFALVGSYGNDDDGFDSGSAYVYDTSSLAAPVPLPAGIWLLAAALGLLAFARRRT